MMEIDLVWVAVSVYMIVLVGYGSYLLRGWIRMRREHREARAKWEQSLWYSTAKSDEEHKRHEAESGNRWANHEK